MPKLKDVCRYIRSKNAGPFWVTVDLFFRDSKLYQQHRDDLAISAAAIGAVFEVDPLLVRRYAIDSLNAVKFSYPRSAPQGGVLERDMHSGQQFVPLLELTLQ